MVSLDQKLSDASLALSRRLLLRGAAGLAVAGAVLPGAAGAASAEAAKKGGRLRLGFAGAGAFKLDAHKSTGDNATDAINNGAVFEALTRQQNDGVVTMWLAESVTPDDATAKVWTIKLKKGVLFHDGRPMTADDVIFSLKRIREPDSTTGGHIGPVDAFEKIDALTVRLRLAAPRSWLPIGLSDPYSAIVPAGYDITKPIGTGPFRVKTVVPSQSVTLERFAKYHGAPAALDEILLLPFEDPAAQRAAVRPGRYHHRHRSLHRQRGGGGPCTQAV
jgi:peptide/nickel transport system substrate-binding protein